MLTLPITNSTGMPGADITLMARVVAQNATGTAVANEGNAVKQADCSTLACAVLNSSGTTLSTPSVSVAAQIHDTLQTGNIWSKNGSAIDAIGYNFLHQIPGATFATGNKVYEIRYTLTLADGTVEAWKHQHTTVPY